MSLDVYLTKLMPANVFNGNITHNLADMAIAAGLYMALWRPEEIHVTHAEQLVPVLENGLRVLMAEPEKFKAMNPENGWGSYEVLVEFVRNYLNSCREHPNAEVSVSR